MVRRTAELNDIPLESPVEALGLPARARNKLHQLGCHSIRFLVDDEFARGRVRLGPGARREVAAALARNGFDVPEDLTPRKGTRLAQLASALLELRKRIDIDQRRWRGRLERLEQQIRKLSE